MKRSDKVFLGAAGILAAFWAYDAYRAYRCRPAINGVRQPGCAAGATSGFSAGARSNWSSSSRSYSGTSSHTSRSGAARGGLGSTGRSMSESS